MKTKKHLIAYVIPLFLIAPLAACSSKSDSASSENVIHKTTTTIERPVIEETQTTTTRTERN
jgi:uncharacterized lipoprotein